MSDAHLSSVYVETVKDISVKLHGYDENPCNSVMDPFLEIYATSKESGRMIQMSYGQVPDFNAKQMQKDAFEKYKDYKGGKISFRVSQNGAPYGAVYEGMIDDSIESRL